MRFRRVLGITIFLAIFAHAGMYIVQWLQINYTILDQLKTAHLFTGYIGILFLFVGYITSNDFSLRLFKGNWKTIQYAAYIALIFAIFHLLFLDFLEYFGQLIVLSIYIVIKLAEKNKFSFKDIFDTQLKKILSK